MTRRRRATAILSLMAAATVAAAWTFTEWRSRAAEPGRLWAQGVAAINAGRDGEAREAFGKCLALKPGDAQCAAGALLLARQTAPVRAAPEDGDLALALRLVGEGRYPAAVALARTVLDREPRDITARAIVKMYTDRADAATYLAKAAGTAGATEDDKGRAIKHWNEGIKHFQKNEPAKARDEWLLCSRLDVDNEDCKSGLQRIDSTYGGAL